ncbi:MAG: hypothetical protein WBJ46_01910, partial [Rectinema sp.]
VRISMEWICRRLILITAFLISIFGSILTIEFDLCALHSYKKSIYRSKIMGEEMRTVKKEQYESACQEKR